MAERRVRGSHELELNTVNNVSEYEIRTQYRKS